VYFDDKAQRIPGTGASEQLNLITPELLYNQYCTMIQEDKIDIFVLGDIKESQIEQAFRKLDFKDRTTSFSAPFYRQDKRKEVRQEEETQQVAQAKLNMAYRTNLYYHEELYYAGQVFNGLFGGFPHSKLFLNVREKESL